MNTKSNYTLLAEVPTSLSWKIKLIFTSVIWFFYISDTKKSWKQFYNGLIPHKCEFDFNNLQSNLSGNFYPCRHHGCNIVSVKDKNGNWLK